MTTVASFCRNCGKALSEEEKTPGAVYCTGCAPTTPPPLTPPAAATTPNNDVSPGLAFLLGLIPGVGAIYNGQYVKGMIHAFVFGLLISIANLPGSHDLEPVIAMLTAGWVPYMAFEAYHTAKRRQQGLVVDEFSSLVKLKGNSMAGPAALIAIGIIFLLNNMELIRLSQVLRFWPVLLIALGAYMMYVRLKENSATVEPPPQEATNEQQ